MGKIIAADGKTKLSNTTVEVDGFEFSLETMQSNPILAIMALIMIDPTEKQKEMLTKFGIQMTDGKGKYIFPRQEDKEDSDS